MEKYLRRMGWMEKMMSGNDNWQQPYTEKVATRERGWERKGKGALNSVPPEKL